MMIALLAFWVNYPFKTIIQKKKQFKLVQQDISVIYLCTIVRYVFTFTFVDFKKEDLQLTELDTLYD